MKRGWASAAALMVAGGATVAVTTPAGAVQTTTFRLEATPLHGSSRSAIQYPGDGSTVHDSVEVANLTARPIVLHIGVVGVTKGASGIYQLGAAGQGLAADVRLSAATIPLAASADKLVDVTVRAPFERDSSRYASIVATQANSSSPGTIVQQLAVLVYLTPAAQKAVATHGSSALVPGLIAIILIVVVLALIVAQVRRRQTPSPTRPQA